MLKTTLLDILKTFSKDESKRFDDFVNSPYFNKKTPVTNLWKEIRKHSPEFDSEKLDRKKIYSELFPGKQFNYGVMKNLIYDLTQLAERYLEEEIFIKNEYRRSEFLLEHFLKKD